MNKFKKIVEDAWKNKDLLNDKKTINCINQVIEEIDKGIVHAVVFGNEIKGVSQEIIDISNNTIEIDQYGTKHSLNVTVAAGIVVWKFYNSLN